MIHSDAAGAPALQSIPLRLAHARQLAGLTARALGELAGLSPYAVRNIERDENPGRAIESGTAASIARVLGLSMEWLICGTGEPPSAAAVRRAVEDAQAAKSTPSA